MNSLNWIIFLRDFLCTYFKDWKNVSDVLDNHQDGTMKTANINNVEKLNVHP